VRTGVRYGLGVALRSGATPLLMGMRWAAGSARGDRSDVPASRWDIKLASKVALDELFLATELASASIVSLRDGRRLGEEVSQAAALFERRGWLDDPASYHDRPPPLEMLSRQDRTSSPMGPYQHLRFESGYQPHRGEPGRERWLGYRANRIAHARLWVHRGRPRPWLVCIPGYRMGRVSVDFTGFRVRWLHRELGLNVAIPVMPLHGPRSQGRRGGDGFLSGNFVDTVHAQTQAAWDVRRLIDWLRSFGAPAVGIHGVSLGGYTAALVASLDPELDCAVVGIPATDFFRLLKTHVPRFLLRALERASYPLDSVEQILRVTSPLVLAPALPRERCCLYAGVEDRLTSPDQARDLWKHWGQPHMEWYDGSHVSFVWERKVKALIREALKGTGMLPAAATRPPRESSRPG